MDSAKQAMLSILRQFPDEKDVAVLEKIAWADAVFTLVDSGYRTKCAQLIGQAEKKTPRMLTTLAAVALQSGDYVTTESHLLEANAIAGNEGAWREWLLMASSLQRQFRTAEAKTWLDKAVAWRVKQDAAAKSNATSDWSWQDRIEFDQFRRELQTTLPIANAQSPPVSSRALVQAPASINGLKSWSLELGGHSTVIDCVAISPDGRFTATGGRDGKICLWEVASNTQSGAAPGSVVWRLQRIFLGHEREVRGLAWSKDGSQLASASADGSLRLWNPATGGGRAIVYALGNGGALAYSPNEEFLAVATANTFVVVRVFDGQRQASPKNVPCNDLCWSPQGDRLVTVGSDGIVRRWKVGPLTLDAELTISDWGKGVSRSLNAAAWTADGTRFVCGGQDGRVRIWDATTWQPLHSVDGQIGTIRDLACQRDGQQLALAGSSKSFAVYDGATGKISLITTMTGESLGVAWHPVHAGLVTVRNGRLQLWSAADAKLVAESRAEAYDDLVFPAQDGSRIMSRWQDRLLFWEAVSGRPTGQVRPVPGGHPILSPQSNRIAFWQNGGNQDTVIVKIDLTDKRPPAQVKLSTKGERVVALEWSPDGRTIASGGSGRQILLWSAETGDLIAALIGHEADVLSLAWSPDGREIVSVSADKTLRVWNVETRVARLNLSPFPANFTPTAGRRLAWCEPERFWLAWGTQLVSFDAGLGKASPARTLRTGATVLELFVVPGQNTILALDTSGNQYAFDAMTSQTRLLTSVPGGSPPYVLGWTNDRTTVFFRGVATHPQLGPSGRFLPRLAGDRWLCLDATGHLRGGRLTGDGATEDDPLATADDQLLFIAVHSDGTQHTYRPREFAAKYGWMNDPTRVQISGKPQ